MAEEKKTLEDIIGKRKFKMWLTPEMADTVMRSVTSNRNPLNLNNRASEYDLMKFVCLADIGIHETTNWCDIGEEGCVLLRTLENFRRDFKDMIDKDPDYTIDDFTFKMKPDGN